VSGAVLLHRFDYDDTRHQFVCVPVPRGGVGSSDRCVGCGLHVTAEELYADDADLATRRQYLRIR